MYSLGGQARDYTRSHVGIGGSFAALRDYPVDVLRRILDVAGLAVHAVLRVDLQARLAFFLAENFIDAGRAEALFGRVVLRQVDADWHRRILQLQMAGLVFLVVGRGQENRRQAVRSEERRVGKECRSRWS